MKNIKEFTDSIGGVNRYMLLDRLKLDCLYFLGYGNKQSRLWGITIENHIKYMKYLWLLFPINEKPEWISMDEILSFENKMKIKE